MMLIGNVWGGGGPSATPSHAPPSPAQAGAATAHPVAPADNAPKGHDASSGGAPSGGARLARARGAARSHGQVANPGAQGSAGAAPATPPAKAPSRLVDARAVFEAILKPIDRGLGDALANVNATRANAQMQNILEGRSPATQPGAKTMTEFGADPRKFAFQNADRAKGKAA